MSSHNRSQVLESLCRRAATHFAREGTPFVTVTYAQSLDGSIASATGEPICISCDESLVYTHNIRASNAGILVGINTVLSDDPRLTTRLVEGESPRPIILDSCLRLPLDARVLDESQITRPIVFTTERSHSNAGERTKRGELEKKGACVIELKADKNGWISVEEILPRLGEMGIPSLMVEGGGTVIKSFIQAKCVNHFIVTLSMKMVAGTPLFRANMPGETNAAFPMKLAITTSHWEGADMIIHGDPDW